MDVRGVGAFFHFVTSNGFNGISPEVNAFVVCIEEYDRLCACDSPQYRESKRSQCKALYENFVSNADRFKVQFLSKISGNKISFYSDDGRHIKTLSR